MASATGMPRGGGGRRYNRRGMPNPQETIFIWPADEAAGVEATPTPGDRPTLAFYHARGGDVSGATVMVLPGGGYNHLAPHEAEPVAHWLNGHGFHAAVLYYRRGAEWPHPIPAQDAQRAMRVLRQRASAWGVRPGAVGVLGFSAGGHLASTLAVHHDDFHCAADDLAGHVSARPDATVLCYPVIDMSGPHAHRGSRESLIRDTITDMADLLTTYRHVSRETPPTFLWHTADDAGVPVQNSLLFATACREHRVPFELHIYETGKHGLGLAVDQPEVATWADHCIAFLRRHLE